VVARLIDPACCYRTAPCPPQLGEGMTGSRNSPALPQSTCTITVWRRPTTTSFARLIFRHPSKACIGPVRRQDRSSSLRCGRSVLTPALNRCRLHGGRKPAQSQVANVLTEPHPFRDDLTGGYLVGPYPEARQCVGAERVAERDVGGVAATCDQHPTCLSNHSVEPGPEGRGKGSPPWVGGTAPESPPR
jgi:hypothetical protein